jgi:hypothetical protein
VRVYRIKSIFNKFDKQWVQYLKTTVLLWNDSFFFDVLFPTCDHVIMCPLRGPFFKSIFPNSWDRFSSFTPPPPFCPMTNFLVTCLYSIQAYSWIYKHTLKIVAAFSSETSVSAHNATWCHFSQDHNHSTRLLAARHKFWKRKIMTRNTLYINVSSCTGLC